MPTGDRAESIGDKIEPMGGGIEPMGGGAVSTGNGAEPAAKCSRANAATALTVLAGRLLLKCTCCARNQTAPAPSIGRPRDCNIDSTIGTATGAMTLPLSMVFR